MVSTTRKDPRREKEESKARLLYSLDPSILEHPTPLHFCLSTNFPTRTMTVKNSQNVLLQDIYVNSTSSSGSSTANTDGADTLYASNITFRRWDVTNGDDSIATKANSSDIFIYDSTFRDGVGVAVGSIGQYPGRYEFISNMVARNITMIKTQVAGKVKTWT